MTENTSQPDTSGNRQIRKLKMALDAGDTSALTDFWQAAATIGTPLIEPEPDDRESSLVTFIWRGTSTGPAPGLLCSLSGREVCEPMLHLPGSDVWHRTYRVRNDTRDRYRFVIDGQKLPDPLNPNQQVLPDDPEAGFKGWVSSIVELPQAPSQEWSQPQLGVAKGKIDLHHVESRVLGRSYRVWVYTPPGNPSDDQLFGLLLVLDGWFYLNAIPTPTILDNLLARGYLPRLAAIFVSSMFDPTRQRDLACHDPFREFLVSELLPWTRARYDLSTDPARCTLVGCSLGGLMASYVGLNHPDLFGNIVAQSGYFGWRSPAEAEDSWIIRQFVEHPRQRLRFALDVGRLETNIAVQAPGLNNLLAGTRHMRDVLKAKGYPVHYHESGGGHNSVNWANTLPLGLMAVLGRVSAGS